MCVVSSGAIALGLPRLGLDRRPRSISRCSRPHPRSARPGFRRPGTRRSLLCTPRRSCSPRRTSVDRATYVNARDALDALLGLGAVPVVNENDATATDEITFGDNDALAAQVAVLLRARLLVLLTEVEGVYSRAPGTPGAVLLEEGSRAGEAVLGAASPLGRGGMRSKVLAAELAAAAGIPTVIAGGDGRRGAGADRRRRAARDPIRGRTNGTSRRSSSGCVSASRSADASSSTPGPAGRWSTTAPASSRSASSPAKARSRPATPSSWSARTARRSPGGSRPSRPPSSTTGRAASRSSTVTVWWCSSGSARAAPGRRPAAVRLRGDQRAEARAAPRRRGRDRPRLRQPRPAVARRSRSRSCARRRRIRATTATRPAAGIPNLRRAICDLYARRFGVELDPETQALTTIGAKEGLAHLMWVLVQPGDAAVVPSPSYPIHLFAPVFAGAAVERVADGRRRRTSSATSSRRSSARGRGRACSCSRSRTTRRRRWSTPVSCSGSSTSRASRSCSSSTTSPTPTSRSTATCRRRSCRPTGATRGRGRAVHADQVVLDGGLAGRLRRRQRGGRRCARAAEVVSRLRHVPADPDRRDRGDERGARLPARGLRGLPLAARRALRRARPHRLGRGEAEGDDVRLGADPGAVPRARLARVRGQARPRGPGRGEPGRRLRTGRRRSRPLRAGRERAADRPGGGRAAARAPRAGRNAAGPSRPRPGGPPVTRSSLRSPDRRSGGARRRGRPGAARRSGRCCAG